MQTALALITILGASMAAFAADEYAPAGVDLETLSPSDIEGKDVFGSDGEKVGDVDELVFDETGMTRLAIIGLDGIVGEGAKEVAVPSSTLSVAQDGQNLAASHSKAALEAMPDVDPGNYKEIEDD